MEKFKSAMIRSLSTELHLNDSYSVRGKRARAALSNKLNFITTKIASPKRTFEDPFRFSDGGVDFRGKLIGITDVPDPRGERMCQDAMKMLKTIVLNSGRHKQRIVINVSTDGIKIKDEKFSAVLYTCPVQRISFICRDITDSRAFGFVFGTPGQPHKFYAIKTERTSDITVLAIRDMFQVVFEMKKKQLEMSRRSHPDKMNHSQASEGSKTEWELFPTTTTTTADVDRETHENQLNELISLEPLPSENLGFPHSVSTPAVNRVQADPFLNDFQLPKSGPLADFNTNNSGNVPKTASQQHAEILALYNSSSAVQQPSVFGTPTTYSNPNVQMSYVTSTPQPSLMNLTVDDPFDTSRVKQLLQGQIAPTIPAIANSFDLPVTTMHLPSQQPTAVNNSHADIFTSENLFSGANANQGGLGNVKSPPDGNSIAQIARPRPTGLAKPLLDINVPSKAASPTTTVNAKGPSKDPFNDEFFN